MTDLVERLRHTAPIVPVCGKAADEIERLRAALMECAAELAEQVEGHYAKTKDHPAMKRRYDRDMAAVLAARAVLRGKSE